MAHLGERKEEKIKNLNSLKFNFCRNYLRVYCVPGTVLDSFCDLVFSVQLLSHLFSPAAKSSFQSSCSVIFSVQLLSCVWVFATPWVAACQAFLFINSGACSNLCPSSWWCHPTISSSVVPFSSCLQSFPASGSFPMSQFFASGGQSVGASASASFSPHINLWVWILIFVVEETEVPRS